MKVLKALGIFKDKDKDKNKDNVITALTIETYVNGVVALAKAVESVATVLVEHHAAIEEMRENQRMIIEAIESTRVYTRRNETKVN